MKMDLRPSSLPRRKRGSRRSENVSGSVYGSISATIRKHKSEYPDDSLMSKWSALVSSRRVALRNRFKGPSQWRRLLCLGILLIDFAIIGIAASLYQLSLIAYEAGTAAVTGGAALAIIIFRIARPSFALDWIFIGAILIGIGLTLMRDPSMSSVSTFVVFSMLLTTLSFALIWIGATTSSTSGRASIMAAGFTALICTAVTIVDHTKTPALHPDTVASVVLLLIGMSLFGLALSLRRKG